MKFIHRVILCIWGFDISYFCGCNLSALMSSKIIWVSGYISLNLKVRSLIHACLYRLAESFPIFRHLKNFVGLSLLEEIHSELLIEFLVNFLKHYKDIEMLVCFCLHVCMSITESNIKLGQELWLVHLCDVKMRFDSSLEHFFSIRIVV